MEDKFLVEFDGSLQYTGPWIFKGFVKWFQCKISDLATNLLQWFNVLYPQKDKVHWTIGVANS